MGEAGQGGGRGRETDPAMLLIQIAASQARIGAFATGARATPQAASDSYRRIAALGLRRA